MASPNPTGPRYMAMSVVQGTSLVSLAAVPSARAFVLVMLPEDADEMLDTEFYHGHTFHYWACPERTGCGCSPNPTSNSWRVDSIFAGRAFDGRLRGIDTTGLDTDDEAVLQRNVLSARLVPANLSAFAVITPDGLWHESPEPEPSDVFEPGNVHTPVASALTPLQLAWRHELQRLMASYPNSMVLGCEAELYSFPTLYCSAAAFEKGREAACTAGCASQRTGPDFRGAMKRVWAAAFEEELRDWSSDFGYDLPTTALLLLHGGIVGLWDFCTNVGLDLPPELDEFTDEDFLGFLESVADGSYRIAPRSSASEIAEDNAGDGGMHGDEPDGESAAGE